MKNILILNLNALLLLIISIVSIFLFDSCYLLSYYYYTDNNFDSSKYRILCKNGSLAQNPGFNVEESCALSVTIDSEVNNFLRN